MKTEVTVMTKKIYHGVLAAAALFFSACSAPAARIVPRPEINTKTDVLDSTEERLNEAKLTFTTTVLEYGAKETDPLKLVRCDNKDVTITTDSHLDLSVTGDQEVVYVLHLSDAERTEKKTFTVKDTRAPEIKLNDQTMTLDYGAEYDPYGNIASVRDPVDGDLKKAEGEDDTNGYYRIEGSVNPQQPGTYELKVIAVDRNGNEKTDTFKVTVGEAPIEEAAAEPAVPLHDYIANINTKKFHYPDCPSVNNMKEYNKKPYYDVTRDDMIAWGYVPCQKCNP